MCYDSVSLKHLYSILLKGSVLRMNSQQLFVWRVDQSDLQTTGEYKAIFLYEVLLASTMVLIRKVLFYPLDMLRHPL